LFSTLGRYTREVPNRGLLGVQTYIPHIADII
jgi:hypothetical protein